MSREVILGIEQTELGIKFISHPSDVFKRGAKAVMDRHQRQLGTAPVINEPLSESGMH